MQRFEQNPSIRTRFAPKSYNIRRGREVRDYIIVVDSLTADIHTSSCDFVFILPENFDSVELVQVISGNIPETTESYLLMDIEELRAKKIYGFGNKNYSAILRYITPATASQNLLDLESENCSVFGDLGRLSQFHVRIYNRLGNLHSFGTDISIIASITNASPAVIQTTVNHGLVNGDVIHIENLTNMSTRSLTNSIEDTPWTITVTGVTTFSIVLDLSGEAADQQLTGTLAAYALGDNAYVEHIGDGSYHVESIVYNVPRNSTIVETDRIHAITVGKLVTITGMDNCATTADNNRFNGRHIVSFVSDTTHFDIEPVLSSYVTPRQATSVDLAYPLGQRGIILAEKFQCSFDIMIRASMHT